MFNNNKFTKETDISNNKDYLEKEYEKQLNIYDEYLTKEKYNENSDEWWNIYEKKLNLYVKIVEEKRKREKSSNDYTLLKIFNDKDTNEQS